MEQDVGIDVSLEEARVCVMDRAGQVLRKTKAASDPEARLQFPALLEHRVTRLGMEAGPPEPILARSNRQGPPVLRGPVAGTRTPMTPAGCS